MTRLLKRTFVALFFLLISGVLTSAAHAQGQAQSAIHWSGKRTLWDRRTNIVRLEGNAAVHQEGETLTADLIILDLDERTVDAQGNCVYLTLDSIIYGQSMHFNLDTRTGTIIAGRVTNDRFTLSGERINKLGEGKFQTHKSEYTTCWDCPASWTFRAEDVDMEIEGYAYMSNVTTKIRDAPALWLPYLIVPLKSKRQTGLLFPRFEFSTFGFRYVQPFFWALSDSVDMTFGLGHFGGQGVRGEWEGRYRLDPHSGGDINVFYLKDSTFEKTNRFAVSVSQVQRLPFQIEQKLRILETSDNLYPATIRDIPGYGEANIASDLIFSRSTDQVSAYLAARRFRNLLNVNSITEFDPSTVQVFPSAAVTSNSKLILRDPDVAAGLTFQLSNFTRSNSAYDQVSVGLDPNPDAPRQIVREATRFSLVPTLFTTLRLWDVLSIVPSAEYRANFYSFKEGIPSLTRGYALFQTDIFTQYERIYRTDDPNSPRLKHLIRPMVTYSLIPWVQEDERHPFVRQIEYARVNNFTGFNFDSYDIIPIQTSRTYANYFVPLGHSISYGLTTQLIRRNGAVNHSNPAYQRTLELQAGQAFNIKSTEAEGDKQPLSRFFSALRLNYDQFIASADYYYIPYLPILETQKRHIFSGTLTYLLERSIRQQVLAFERSFSLSYQYNRTVEESGVMNLRGAATYSINDYIRPFASASYNYLTREYLDWGGGLSFQSPSRCWKFDVSGRRYRCGEQGLCNEVGIDFSLNLTGAGFGTMTDLASGVSSP